MKNVIVDGRVIVSDRFYHKCRYCETIFSYQKEDITIDTRYKSKRGLVLCPVCENIELARDYNSRERGAIKIWQER